MGNPPVSDRVHRAGRDRHRRRSHDIPTTTHLPITPRRPSHPHPHPRPRHIPRRPRPARTPPSRPRPDHHRTRTHTHPDLGALSQGGRGRRRGREAADQESIPFVRECGDKDRHQGLVMTAAEAPSPNDRHSRRAFAGRAGRSACEEHAHLRRVPALDAERTWLRYRAAGYRYTSHRLPKGGHRAHYDPRHPRHHRLGAVHLAKPGRSPRLIPET